MSDEIIGSIDFDDPIDALNLMDVVGPDKHPINVLHRGHPGQIAFHWKDARTGEFVEHGGFNVNARDLCGPDPIFEEYIARFVDKDGYFSIDGIAQPKRRTPSVHDERFSKYCARQDRIQWLNSCWVDLDCGIDRVETAVMYGFYLQYRQMIPPFTICSRSGNGVWFHWLLQDRDWNGQPGKPWGQYASADAISTHARINEKLLQIFSKFNPDANALGINRITRVPGSLNSSANRRTKYTVQHGDDGKPHAYLIDDLARAFNVPITRHPAVVRRIIGTVDPMNRTKGIRGFSGRWAAELTRFYRLIALRRGTIHEHQHGGRNAHAWVMSVILQKCVKAKLMEPDQATELVWQFGKRACDPPLSDKAIQNAIDYARNVRDDFSQITIGNKLKITPHEAQQTGWKAEGTERTPKTTPQKDRTLHRRELVRKIIDRRGYVPIIRDISNALAKEGVLSDDGNPINTATIKNDLHALGIENPRKRRPKTADAQTMLLPD